MTRGRVTAGPVLGSGAMSVTAARAQADDHAARRAPERELDLETRLIATIPQVFRHLLAHARRRSAWRDLTYQQYNVMRIIDVEGPMPQGEIARRLLVSAPVVTRLAGGLVETGLAERGRDPRDRRA